MHVAEGPSASGLPCWCRLSRPSASRRRRVAMLSLAIAYRRRHGACDGRGGRVLPSEAVKGACPPSLLNVTQVQPSECTALEIHHPGLGPPS
jgi:hypothetical protein